MKPVIAFASCLLFTASGYMTALGVPHVYPALCSVAGGLCLVWLLLEAEK